MDVTDLYGQAALEATPAGVPGQVVGWHMFLSEGACYPKVRARPCAAQVAAGVPGSALARKRTALVCSAVFLSLAPDPAFYRPRPAHSFLQSDGAAMVRPRWVRKNGAGAVVASANQNYVQLKGKLSFVKASNTSDPVVLPTIKLRMADVGWSSGNNLGQRVRVAAGGPCECRPVPACSGVANHGTAH